MQLRLCRNSVPAPLNHTRGRPLTLPARGKFFPGAPIRRPSSSVSGRAGRLEDRDRLARGAFDQRDGPHLRRTRRLPMLLQRGVAFGGAAADGN